jgi:hypothetical protein
MLPPTCPQLFKCKVLIDPILLRQLPREETAVARLLSQARLDNLLEEIEVRILWDYYFVVENWQCSAAFNSSTA